MPRVRGVRVPPPTAATAAATSAATTHVEWLNGTWFCGSQTTSSYDIADRMLRQRHRARHSRRPPRLGCDRRSTTLGCDQVS